MFTLPRTGDSQLGAFSACTFSSFGKISSRIWILEIDIPNSAPQLAPDITEPMVHIVGAEFLQKFSSRTCVSRARRGLADMDRNLGRRDCPNFTQPLAHRFLNDVAQNRNNYLDSPC